MENARNVLAILEGVYITVYYRWKRHTSTLLTYYLWAFYHFINSFYILFPFLREFLRYRYANRFAYIVKLTEND